ncbi:MAG: DnaJ family domain-containing protein [Desulfosalsimonadaceae bacterium]
MFTGFEKLVEERILAAQRNGEFKNLEGAGKPLAPEDMSRVPQELRLAYKILKNADCLPPEVELQKEIITTEKMLSSLKDEQQRYKAMKKLNFLIMKFNTLTNRAIQFEIPQKYEEALVSKMAADTTPEKKGT